MGSFLHDPDVLRRGIGALAVLDGVGEAVPKLSYRAQEVVLDEIHHAVIWDTENATASNNIVVYNDAYKQWVNDDYGAD